MKDDHMSNTNARLGRDPAAEPTETPCDACGNTPGILWADGAEWAFYGHTAPPLPALLVQACGNCDNPFEGDLDAAVALAALLGCRVHAIAHGDYPTEAAMLAHHSDVWLTPEPAGPVVWHPEADAIANEWLNPRAHRPEL